MNQTTVNQINLINKDFYGKISSQWNQKTDSKWTGWDKVITHLQTRFAHKKTIRVLDLGCGNGRFATFINANLTQHIEYTGVDFDTFFLQQAKKRKEFDTSDSVNYNANLNTDNLIPSKPFVKFQLIDLDITKEAFQTDFQTKSNNQKYDLVVAFGLIHHIASYQNRLKLLQFAKSCLDTTQTTENKPLLVWTSWRFLDQPRLLKRIVGLDSGIGQQIINDNNLDTTELESGDHFLNWVKHEYAVRFSHYIDDQEAQNLNLDSNLKLVDAYLDDSITQNLNGYYVCE